MAPKITLNDTSPKARYIFYFGPQVPNYHHFWSTTNRFWSNSHFGTSAAYSAVWDNVLKSTSNTISHRYPFRLYPFRLYQHPEVLNVTIWSAVFEIQALQISAPNCPKGTLSTTRSDRSQKYPIYHVYVLLIPEAPNFNLVHPKASPCRVTGHFEPSSPNNPNVTLNTKR